MRGFTRSMNNDGDRSLSREAGEEKEGGGATPTPLL